jgi:DNA-binding transcriptional LysR family regulator
MDTRFLESLIAVVETGSIAGAARQQWLTAAAVSQRIQALERELECKLLSRSSHSAKPTEACYNILPRARKLVQDAESLKDDIDIQGLSGALRIGLISTALIYLLPTALKKLSKIAPNIKPHITPGVSKFLYNELISENIDAAIIIKPAFKIPKKLAVQTLWEEPLILLSKEQGTRSVEEIISSEPYICYDSESWGGRIADGFLIENGLHPRFLCELDDLEAIYLLVSKGMGVALLPYWPGLKSKQHQLTVTVIKGDQYLRKIVLVTHQQGPLLKKIDKFKLSLISGGMEAEI